jgi:MFS superfamily sulfate permease-like transporter
MSEVSGVTLVGSGRHPALDAPLPRSVVLYDVVPAIDATGLIALESLVRDLNHAGIKVVFVGVQDQPLRAFARAGWRNRTGRLRIFRSVVKGLEVARRTGAQAEGPSAPDHGTGRQ